jgi:hypothetical protein
MNCFFFFNLVFNSNFLYIIFFNLIILLSIFNFFFFLLSTFRWVLVLSFSLSLFVCFFFKIWPLYFYFVFHIVNIFIFNLILLSKNCSCLYFFFSTLNLLIDIFYFKSFCVIGFFPDFIIQHLICWWLDFLVFSWMVLPMWWFVSRVFKVTYSIAFKPNPRVNLGQDTS